jgi:hypothetical protein
VQIQGSAVAKFRTFEQYYFGQRVEMTEEYLSSFYYKRPIKFGTVKSKRDTIYRQTILINVDGTKSSCSYHKDFWKPTLGAPKPPKPCCHCHGTGWLPEPEFDITAFVSNP